LGNQSSALSGRNYAQSRIDYDHQWQRLDYNLYRVCEENQGHSDLGGLNAKVYLIARTYQSGIERKVRSKGTQGSSLSQVVSLFHQHSRQMEQLFNRLATISEPLTPEKATVILEIHGRIVSLLSQLTIDGQSARSFVSKYMHFHNSNVPIYDDITAVKVLPSLIPIRSKDAQIPHGADQLYAAYVHRFLKLQDWASQSKLSFTVRSLDYYLVWEHERRVVQKAASSAPVDTAAADPMNQEIQPHG